MRLAAVVALSLTWLVCFSLALDDSLRGTPGSPILARFGSDLPTVVSVKPIVEGSAGVDLAPGDRITQAAGQDTRGMGPFAWEHLVATLPSSAETLPLVVLRGGETRAVDVPVQSRGMYWPRLVASLAFLGCALFLALTPGTTTPVREAFAFAYLWAAIYQASYFSGGWFEVIASNVLVTISLSVTAVLSLRAFLLLRPGAAADPPWMRFGPWIFVLFGPLDLARFTGVPFSHEVGSLGLAVLLVPYLACIGMALFDAWRRSALDERRRVKWAVLGIYLGTAFAALPELFTALKPQAGPYIAIVVSAEAIMPVCVLIGVLRHNFLDIDRMLSVTIASSVAVLALFVGGSVLLPRGAALVADLTGAHEATAEFLVLALSLALILPLVSPLRRRVDQALFTYRFERERDVSRLVEDLSGCTTPTEVAELTAARLVGIYKARSFSFYIHSNRGFVPAVAVNADDAPVFPLGSPVVATLREQRGPLGAREHEEAFRSLGTFQRAVLDTLGASLVVPVARGDELAAFLCLGAKGSGDVYSAIDRTLMALVADKIGSQLLRIDQAGVIASGDHLRERLQQFAPGQLDELEVGEREVSVLFVDLRGYSQFAEPLSPDQLFGVVNAYTQLVGEIVARWGGTIVDFSGDGIMAVFGAPRSLDGKEAAAVRAGLEVVEQVPTLSGDRGDLSAGVGIATGNAFVGNVRTIDRMFWTALGNPTNLASRLQGMTRDVSASMIIDRATWEAAGVSSHGFLPYVGTTVRGRTKREDLYVLPLGSVA